MHVAWTFMSESFAKHAFTVVRLSMHNMLRFHSVSWPCDGQECPSYLQFLLSMFREVPNTISAEWSLGHRPESSAIYEPPLR